MTHAKPSCPSTLLRVRGLTVRYAIASESSHPALMNLGFDIRAGETLGILGESGSGKSTLALSILGLLPVSTDITGAIFFEDKDLLQWNQSEWETIRGTRIAMIFQEPGLSLSQSCA